MKYRADIDGLRAVAVVSVLLAHAHFEFFGGGFVGVDVFFVISGYLITSILVAEARQGSFSLAAFYERRARRIFPALFSVVFFTGVVAYLLYPAKEFAAFGRSVVATTFFLSNFLFWQESGYFDVASAARPLLHTWSVAVEEQFYVFFPMAVWLTWRHLRGRFELWLFPVIASSFALSIWWVEAYPSAAFYLAPARVWELLIGSVLALGLVPLPRSPFVREAAAGLGLACIAVSVVTFSAQSPFPGINALLPCVGAGMIIYAGQAGGSLVGRLLSLRPVVFVGLISYSLYLWHWPLFVFARHFQREPLSGPMSAGVLVLSGLLACLSWRYIERPFRRSPKSPAGALVLTRRSVFSASAAASATCLVFGIGVAASSGLPSRFPDVEALIRGPGTDPSASISGCTPLSQSLDEIREHCSFGEPDAETSVVVWGDSHASAWQFFFRSFAEEHQLKGILLSASGCPPLVGAYRIDDPSAKNPCEPGTASRFMDLIEEIEPRAVFLVSRWSVYNHGWIRKGILHTKTMFLSDDQLESTRAEDSQQVFARALERTVSALRADATTVVVVKSVPIISDAPSELYWNETRGRRVEPGRAEHLEWQRLASDEIDSHVDQHTVFALDPTDSLCGSVCSYRDGVGFYYRDDNHLSRHGNAVLYAALRADLRALWAKIEH